MKVIVTIMALGIVVFEKMMFLWFHFLSPCKICDSRRGHFYPQGYDLDGPRGRHAAYQISRL